jgi:hypothetical protein
MWGYVTRKGRGRASRDLAGMSEKRPLGGPRYTLKDDIKMYLQEIGWVGFVWFVLFDDSGRLLCMRRRTLGLHKMLGSSL